MNPSSDEAFYQRHHIRSQYFVSLDRVLAQILHYLNIDNIMLVASPRALIRHINTVLPTHVINRLAGLFQQAQNLVYRITRNIVPEVDGTLAEVIQLNYDSDFQIYRKLHRLLDLVIEININQFRNE